MLVNKDRSESLKHILFMQATFLSLSKLVVRSLFFA